MEPWNVGILVLGAKNLPKLDVFGLSDPYVCLSVLSCGKDVQQEHTAQVEHNVSKFSSAEHAAVERSKTDKSLKNTFKIIPQNRTRVVRKTLTPRWTQIFQFREARSVKLESASGALTVAEQKVPISADQRLKMLITLHDRDVGMKDDFSGRLVIDLKANEPVEGEFMLLTEDGQPLIGHSGQQASILLKAVYSMCEYLDEPITDKEVEQGDGEFCKYAVTSMQGWRTTMEDAHFATMDLDGKKSCFFGVYDGHGGADVAAYAGRHLHENVLSSQHFATGAFAKALTEGFLRTDKNLVQPEGIKECAQIRKEQSLIRRRKTILTLQGLMPQGADGEIEFEDIEEEEAVAESGSTAVTCLVVGKELYCANAGDSRAVLCRSAKGVPVAVELSHDHKPTKESELQRIEASGHAVVDHRIDGVIAVSRCIGDFVFKTAMQLPAWEQAVTACPEVMKFAFQEGDEFMVLACDGIWDCMSSQAVVEHVHSCLTEGMSLPDVLASLLTKCLTTDPAASAGIGTDNMTAMIVQFKK